MMMDKSTGKQNEQGICLADSHCNVSHDALEIKEEILDRIMLKLESLDSDHTSKDYHTNKERKTEYKLPDTTSHDSLLENKNSHITHPVKNDQVELVKVEKGDKRNYTTGHAQQHLKVDIRELHVKLERIEEQFKCKTELKQTSQKIRKPALFPQKTSDLVNISPNIKTEDASANVVQNNDGNIREYVQSYPIYDNNSNKNSNRRSIRNTEYNVCYNKEKITDGNNFIYVSESEGETNDEIEKDVAKKDHFHDLDIVEISPNEDVEDSIKTKISNNKRRIVEDVQNGDNNKEKLSKMNESSIAESNSNVSSKDPSEYLHVQDFGQLSTTEPITMYRRRKLGDIIPDFWCIICEMEFDFSNDMNYHMSRFHKMKCLNKSFSCSSCVNDIPDCYQMSIDRDQKETVDPCDVSDKLKSVGSYSCKMCTQTFRNIELLHTHIGTFHNFHFKHIRTFCSYCQKCLSGDIYEVFTLIANFSARRKHPLTDEGKGHETVSHLCKFCTVPCKNISEVALHRKLHYLGKQKYSCLICRKKFRNWHSLEVHVWVHYDKTPFKCRYCSKYISDKSHLTIHEKNHLPNYKKPFICDECPGTFAAKSHLRRHKLTHSKKRYQCDLCIKSFKFEDKMIEHKVKKHTRQFRFTCDICGQGAVTAYKLKIHKESHEDIRCHICNAHIASHSGLQMHIKSRHGTKRYQCEQCGKKLASKLSLQKHYIMHTTDKPFKCDKCDKSFRRSKGLQIHMQHHLGIKPHACTYCDKAFYTQTNLQDHIRIHTGEKPYKCQVCHKAFAKSCNLKKHKKILKHETQLDYV